MSNSEMPYSAAEWADYLVSKSLPSPFKVGQKVLRHLEKEKLPYAKVAHIVNGDPILAFYIISHANDTQLEDTPSSKTLAHAISMVGIDKLEDLIRQQPFKAISLKNITSFYYLRALSTSLYAGHLGKAISIRKKKGNPEDLYWSSLFVGAPVWYLWRFATPEMRLVRYAIRSNFKLPETAEKEVLGDTMIDVLSALAMRLNLPELAQTCYQQDKQLSKRQWVSIARSFRPDGSPLRIDDRDIALLMQSPHFIVMLANLISHYSSYCWYSRATLRAQRILACYLNCPLDEAISLTHQAAADMSRAHPMPGVMQPAAKLFVPPRKRTKAKMVCKLSHFQEETFSSNQQEAALSNDEPLANASKHKIEDKTNSQKVSDANKVKDNALDDKRQLDKAEATIAPEKISKATDKSSETTSSETTNSERTKATEKAKTEGLAKDTASKPKETPSENPLFVELTQIMSQKPEEFSDLHELMNAATQGIAYGIELERASVGLISKDGSRLKNYYSVGCQNHEELKNFESQIVKSTIFAKLSERPASVWVKPSSDKKILDLIPSNFKNAVDSKEYFLMSVFVKKRPVAIFFADNADQQSLTQEKYKQFKYLCSAVTTSLQHQANRSASKLE